MKTRRHLLLILTAAFLVTAFGSQSYSQTRKELLKENQKLRRAIDSLQNLIGEEIEIADTSTTGDTINPGNMGFLPQELYENLSPETNQDSLLSIWYMQRQMANAKHPSIADIGEAHYTSNIPDEVYIENLKKMNSYITLPYNEVVRNYIILYTEKMRRTPTLLGLSSYYLPIFENIFDSYGLPKELAAMAIIESALNPFAVSSANAKGMWQFIYSAARMYNLEIDSYIDERLDPEKSCDAAARYLKDAYAIFGDWALAISSYNCGAGNVNKAIRRAGGSRDFWSIYPYLPRETRGYVPAFVGALYLLKYYPIYNIVPEKTSMPAHVDTFMIHRNLHFEQISEVIGIPVQDIRQLNPQYLHDIIPGTAKGMILRLPYNYTAPFVDNESSIYSYKDSIYFNPILYNKYKGGSSDEGSSRIYHKVRKGQTLSSIAKRYGVTVSQIKDWNNISGKSVKTGRRLIIYRKAAAKTSTSSSSSKSAYTAKTTSGSSSGASKTYTVKKGDTLYGIAKKHNMSLNDLLKLNGLTTKSKIHAGKKIIVK